jgi:hypothetical protein
MNTDIEMVSFGLEAQVFGQEAQVIWLSLEGLSIGESTHTHTHT